MDAHALAHLGGDHGPTLRQQVATLGRLAVCAALLTTLLGYGGVFTSYVYIAPQLTDVAGFDRAWITLLLLLFGAGLFVGNHLGGRLADRRLMPAIFGTLGALAIALLAMGPALHSRPIAMLMMFLFGMAAFAVVAPLQLRVMNAAGHAPDAASAANVSAFSLSSALGIYLGWAAIDGGLGLASVNWIGPMLTTSGLAAAALSAVLVAGDRARKRPPTTTSTSTSRRSLPVITTDLRDIRWDGRRIGRPTVASRQGTVSTSTARHGTVNPTALASRATERRTRR